MDTEDQFDKSIELTKITLLLSGIKVYQIQWHPTIEIIINSLFYMNAIILYSVIFGEIYWLVDGIQIGRDFVEMSLTAPCITISILSTLKIAPLYYKKEFVDKLINELKSIHPKSETKKVEYDIKINTSGETGMIEKNKNAAIEITNETVKILRTIMLVFIMISLSVLVTFLLAPLLVIYLGYLKTGEMKIIYPFSVKYWFNIYEVDLWQLVYFVQAWATIIVTVNFFATETLFYVICSYIEMHFRILCYQLENIQANSTRTIEELMKEVKMHQHLIRLVDQTESLFTQSILFHIVISSLLICLSAFNISVARDLGSELAFVTFLMLSLSQISLLCFFGDKLMRASTDVTGAIYKCPWYEFDLNARKAVFILLMRSQKPCKLTAANFADLNLRAFTTILSRSWSYFALLKTVYN